MWAWRRVLVASAVTVVAWTVLVQPAGAQRAPVTDTTPSARARDATATGQSPNPSAAVGFVLIGGWVLAGGVLFRQGRRRLAAHKSHPARDTISDDGAAGRIDVNEADQRVDGEQPVVSPARLPAHAAPE